MVTYGLPVVYMLNINELINYNYSIFLFKKYRFFIQLLF
jgi:hypothetical protein